MTSFFRDNPKSEQDLYAEIQAREATYKRVKKTFTYDDTLRATAISKAYPNFSPDVITALTTLQVRPEAEVLNEISKTIIENNSKTLLDKVTDPLQAGVRLAFLGLEDVFRTFVDRPINSAIAAGMGKNADELGFWEAYKQSGKSTVKQAINQLNQGREVNIGEGFLPKSEVFDPENPNSKFYDEYQYMIRSGFEQDKAARVIQNYLGTPITEIDYAMQEGNPNFQMEGRYGETQISLGRSLAVNVAEPNTRTFNVVSGLLDATKVLFLDPANYASFGLKFLTKGARKLKAPDYLVKELQKIDPDKLTKSQKDIIGASERGWGLPFLSGRSISNYLANDAGGFKLVEYLADLTDTNKFIELTGIKDREAIAAFMDISQDFTKSREDKIIEMGDLLSGFLGDPFGPFGQTKPTVGAIGRFLGGATETLFGSDVVPKGTGALFGAKKVIKTKLMDSNSRASRILATYAGEFPYRYVDSGQLDDAVTNIKMWLDQTALDSLTKNQILDRAIRLKDGDQTELFNVIKDMVRSTADDLVENGGVAKEAADDFAQLFEGYLPEMRKYFVDAVTGNNVANPGAKFGPITVDGKTFVNPDPHLITEFINRSIPLPDPGQLAKALNSVSLMRMKAPGLFKDINKSINKGKMSALIDSYYSDFWKPFVLLRGAWLLRVVGEEQLRMYTRGYENIFSRPLSLLSLSLLRKADATEAKRWTQKGVTFTDLKGDPLSEAIEWQAASSRRFGLNSNDHLFGGAYKGKVKKKNHIPPMDVISKSDVLARKETQPYLAEKYFDDGFTREVSHLHYDRLFNFMYRGANTQKQRQLRLEEFVKGETNRAKDIIEEYGKGGPTYVERMSTAGGRYSYAKSIEARVHQVSGGSFDQNVDLLESLSTKVNFDDIDFSQNPFPLSIEKTADNRILESLLRNRLDRINIEFADVEKYGKSGATWDDFFKGTQDGSKNIYNKIKNTLMNEEGDFIEHLPEMLAVGKTDYLDSVSKAGMIVNNLFDFAMGQRTDNASRSPVFRQKYWRSVYDMLPYMSGKMRKIMLDGGTFTNAEGKTITVAGARNAKIPNENLFASIRNDIGLPSSKMRRRETEINLDMFEREVKRLNARDKSAGKSYEDIDVLYEGMVSDHQKQKKGIEDLIKSEQDKLEDLNRNIWGTYGDTPKENIPDNLRSQIDELEESIFDLQMRMDNEQGKFQEGVQEYAELLGFTDKYSDADFIDRIAKSDALAETKDLLYDLSKRKKLTYNLRGIFPFGEAYVEIMTTWARLIKENPEILRRGQVTVDALREKNPFSPVEGEGFLGEDEITGEEVFYYPMVDEFVSDALFGEDRNIGVRLPGYAGSLNLALEIVPGIGPAIAIPASFFVNASPSFDEVKKVMFPYGLPDIDSAGDLMLAAGVPAWLKNTIRATYAYNEDVGQNEMTRIAANTTIDVYRILKADGRSDRTVQEQEDLMKEARSIARNLTFIKAASQFVGPTGLNPRFDVGNEKNGGSVYSMQILSDRYRELIDTPPKDDTTGKFAYAPGDNYSATKYFMDEFGFNPLDIATPKTVVVEPRPVDERGVKFQKENPELFEDFSFTAQYVIPKGGGGAFDYEAYVRTIAKEQREPLTPEEWLAKRNQKLGDFYMEEKRVSSLETYNIADPYQNELRNRFMTLQRDIARERFPGFDSTVPGIPQTATLDMQFTEIKKWRNNPKLNNSPVGRDVRVVLNRIDKLEDLSKTMGLSKNGWKTSRSMLQQRQDLRDLIGNLINNNPDFSLIAERLLLPLFQERYDFLEDLEYDYDTMKEYGAFLPKMDEGI